MNEISNLDEIRVRKANVPYTSRWARVDDYSHVRLCICGSAGVRYHIEWSFLDNGDEVCASQTGVIQEPGKWLSHRTEIFGKYLRLRVLPLDVGPVTLTVTINVLGRYSKLDCGGLPSSVRIDDVIESGSRERRSIGDRVSEAVRSASAHRRSKATPKGQEAPQSSLDIALAKKTSRMLPPVVFKNSILVCKEMDSLTCLPHPPPDGCRWALTCRNNVVEWVLLNESSYK